MTCQHCGQPFQPWECLTDVTVEEQRRREYVDGVFSCPVCRGETHVRFQAGPSIPVEDVRLP
jgi:hypothetical protein